MTTWGELESESEEESSSEVGSAALISHGKLFAHLLTLLLEGRNSPCYALPQVSLSIFLVS